MSRKYFNRYEFFEEEGDFKIVPGIEIPIRSTDKYVQYKKGKDRFDKISQEYYNTPVFGWLILQANPKYGGLEWNIPDGDTIIIPFPLVPTLEEYKTKVDEYYYYYGR